MTGPYQLRKTVERRAQAVTKLRERIEDIIQLLPFMSAARRATKEPIIRELQGELVQRIAALREAEGRVRSYEPPSPLERAGVLRAKIAVRKQRRVLCTPEELPAYDAYTVRLHEEVYSLESVVIVQQKCI